MVAGTKEHTADWTFEAVALGVPARVRANKVVEDPHNLGPGWVGYNFTSALGSPVRILNDASLQGLGSYDGGRMLFLGLGTGVGSAIIAERLILPLDDPGAKDMAGSTHESASLVAVSVQRSSTADAAPESSAAAAAAMP